MHDIWCMANIILAMAMASGRLVMASGLFRSLHCMVMQNAKGKKKVTPSCQTFCKCLALYAPPVMDVLQIHDWIHDWNCEVMIGGLILINRPQGGRFWAQVFEEAREGQVFFNATTSVSQFQFHNNVVGTAPN